MSIYSSPPPARTFHEDKPTLLVCWWCTVFAAVIILFRVCGRYIRSERLFREDWLAFACIIPLFARMGLVHVILLYGTNNIDTTGLAPDDIHRRSIGSRLVLASRIFYAATLWMLKLTISEFFKRLTASIWTRTHELMLKIIRGFLVATFIAVVIADIAECQPITHYWQVVPDPGAKCRQGYAQLLTMGTANVMTDILLVVFPIPIIIRSQMGLKRKFQLVFLFAGSLLPAGTTLYRIPNIIDRNGSQQYRSLLASIEILFAAAIANALILGSFVRDKGVKKQRWKLGSMSDSVERTGSRRGTAVGRQWGSDEDLVRDLGLGVDPALRGEVPHLPRPAPMAIASNLPVKGNKARERQSSWQFPGGRSDTSEDVDMKGNMVEALPTDMLTPRKVSFFDVDGLLEDDERNLPRISDTDGESSTQGAQSNWSYEHGLSPPPRRGSTAILQDVGGLLGPSTRHSRNREKERSRGYELQPISHESGNEGASTRRSVSRPKTTHSLQDVGGLLR